MVKLCATKTFFAEITGKHIHFPGKPVANLIMALRS